MAKMLVIDSVRKCLFRATGGVCSHPDAPEIDPGPGDDADICWDYPDRFPDWCPLSDFDPEKDAILYDGAILTEEADDER